jgi:Rieske Fe-S protein
LDRREFIRRLIIASALGVAAVSGIAVLAEKVLPSQTTSLNTLPPQSTSTQETTGSSTSSSTVIDSTTPSTSKSTTSGTTSKSKTSTTSSKTTARTTTTSTQSSSSSSIPNGYIFLAPLSAMNGKTSAYFSHPTFGSSILINYNGTWKAFSAVCTHAGCIVNYNSSITCPCHPGVFSPANGSVVSGPPPSKLAEYDVQIINNNLYVGNSVIN